MNADSRAPRAADWEPAQGDAVLLLTMGGSKGQVVVGPDAKGRYSVKVCTDKDLGCINEGEMFKDTKSCIHIPASSAGRVSSA